MRTLTAASLRAAVRALQALGVAGSLLACATASEEAGQRRAATAGAVDRDGARDGAARLPRAAPPTDSPAGAYHLSLDLHRQEGCSETFVGIRSSGHLEVEVSRYGQSSLTVELTEVERSGPTRRTPGKGSQISTRSWRRSYRWAGRAGFMGSSAQLHLRPVGTGCAHQDLTGIRGSGCRGALPGLVVECNPARLADAPVAIRRRSPGVDGPTDGHATCRVEVAGPRDKVRLPSDLRFLSRSLLLTRNGKPELLLRLFVDWNLIEGELRPPRRP